MKSPFPGMDPFLERRWRDVHHRLVTYACDQLQPRLPSDLRARLEERVFVESDDALGGRAIYPDVHVVEGPASDLGRPATGENPAAVADSVVVRLAREPATQGSIEIVEASSGNRVVTVVEFLSPSNKWPGEGRELYLRKQREATAAGAALVEIDLTRSGPRRLLVPPGQIPSSHRTPYLVCVYRPWQPDRAELIRAPLARPLPSVPVPLRQGEAEARLDLQPLVDLAYANGRHDDLDYGEPLDPPLAADDAAWAEALLHAAGRRGSSSGR